MLICLTLFWLLHHSMCYYRVLIYSLLFYNVKIKEKPLNEQVCPNFNWYCIYSAFGKQSDPLTFSTLVCYSLILKWIKQSPGSRKSLGDSKLLPFKNDGGHCVLGGLQCCIHFLVPFPQICASTQSCLRALWTLPLTPWPAFCSYIPFQIMSNLLNLPQVDSNQVVETSQGCSMETGCT